MIPVDDWSEILSLEAKMLAEPQANILRLFEIGRLDPKSDFQGGDWRYVKFDNLDLTSCDFSHTRLYGAKFTGSRVAGTNFRGSDVEVTNLDRALDWREAELDEDQMVILELKSLRRGKGQVSPEQAEKIKKVKKLTEPEWVSLIMAAKSFAMAEQLYDMMASEENGKLSRSKYALTSLLVKANTPYEVKIVTDRFHNLDVPFDIYAVNTLISKAFSKSEAINIYKNFDGKVNYDQITFNALLTRFDDLKGAEEIFEAMSAKGFRPDTGLLHLLLKRSSDLEEALVVYRRIERPRTTDMNMVFAHAWPEDLQDGGEVAGLLESGPPRNAITFNILIRRAGTLHRGWHLVDRMKREGFSPDRYTAFNMLSLLREHEVDAAFGVLSRCLREGIDIDLWDVVRLVTRIISDTSGEPQRIIVREEEAGASWSDILVIFAHRFANAAIAQEFSRAVSEHAMRSV
jgi:hypothetical protein